MANDLDQSMDDYVSLIFVDVFNYTYVCITLQGIDLTTGHENPSELQKWGADNVHYMRIRLNKHNRVHTIVGLTKKVFNIKQ